MRGQLQGSVHVASWQLQTAVLFYGRLQKLPWEKQAELTASPPSLPAIPGSNSAEPVGGPSS